MGAEQFSSDVKRPYQMTRRHRLSRLVDVLLSVGIFVSIAAFDLWCMLCVQDGYAHSAPASHATPYISSATTVGSLGRYPFDTSATPGKTASLIIFGVASAAGLAGLILKDHHRSNRKRRAHDADETPNQISGADSEQLCDADIFNP